MKIYSAPQTLAMLAWIAWGVVGIEVFVLDLLDIKPFAALLAAAATVSVAAAMRYHGKRVAAATNEHAARIEAATRKHGMLLTKHILTIEKIFQLGLRGDARTRLDVEGRSLNAHDSGPFKIYKEAN